MLGFAAAVLVIAWGAPASFAAMQLGPRGWQRAVEGQQDAERRTAPAAPAESSFARHVRPILVARCGACHGEARQRGGLALHDAQRIREGGESGPVLGGPDPSASELLCRLRLPLGDSDHMPPRGREQPSAEELAVLASWILAGARFDGEVAAVEAAARQARSVATEPAAGSPPPLPDVPPADPRALDALRKRFVHVQPLGPTASRLWIDFHAAAGAADDGLVSALLGPILPQVVELSLARTRITDAVLELVARMPQLERLDLSGTAITGRGLSHLRGHSRLEALVLVRTTVGDPALGTLRDLPALERVHLWATRISPEGIAKLRAERLRLAVLAGDRPPSKVLEEEGAIELTRAAPGPPGSNPAGAPIPPAAENATCPVSGAAVDARYTILFEGRLIAFCCRKCPEKFWADPASFSVKLPAR